MESGSMQASTEKRLEGKVAVITGGCSGIGETTARLFVSHGAKVVIADIQDRRGQSLCRELGVTFIHCDVTEEVDVMNVVDATIAKYGKLDIMFNNAGIAGTFVSQILNCTSEDLKKVLDVNVYGSFLGAKHAARVMIPEKKGTIIFHASVSSVIAGGIGHAYLTSKRAVVGMTKSLCAELGQYGIRVNCVSPYIVVNQMVATLLNKEESKAEELISSSGNLKGAVLKSADVAEAVLYLASDEAKYTSGLNLVLDGGFSTTNPTFPVIYVVYGAHNTLCVPFYAI